MKKADQNDWLVISTGDGKEIPGLKDALLRKMAREGATTKKPAKVARTKKEATR
jgi:hypothetical protein